MDGRGAIVAGCIETCSMSGGRSGASRIKVGSGCLKILVMTPGSVRVVILLLVILLLPFSSDGVKGADEADRTSRTARTGGWFSL